jgi:hypothetical protein
MSSISPAEVRGSKIVQEKIPDQVFQAFTNLITRKYNSRTGESRILLKDVLREIKTLLSFTTQTIEAHHWLDVEAAYGEIGWHVSYHQPAGLEAETYEPYYLFKSLAANR